jgi:hypothetical protein
MSTTQTFSPKNAVFNDERVQIALAKFEGEQRKYLDSRASLAALLDPLKKSRELQTKIANAESAEELQFASAELSALLTPAAKLASERAGALSRKAFGPLKSAAIELLATADTVLAEIVDKIKADEVEFYQNYGLEHEPTALSRITHQYAEKIKHHIDMLSRNIAVPAHLSQPAPSNALAEIAALFQLD